MKRCVFIQGGLGNQMFGYAFFLIMKQVYPQMRVSTYFFSRHHDHNGLEIDRIFPVRLAEGNKTVAKIYWKLYYTSLRHTFAGKCCSCILKALYFLHAGLCVERTSLLNGEPCSDIQNRHYRMYLGYWATEYKRFSGIEKEIRDSFSFNMQKLSPQSDALLKELAKEKNSISLHVRRGDYLKNPQFLDICNAAYYRKAVEVINSKASHARFFVFSDDIAWVKEHLSLPEETTYIDWNAKDSSWQDMCLMSHCRHNIIANSTFSWWGAWLNANPDKIVICPKEYSRTQDFQIMPEEWIKI